MCLEQALTIHAVLKQDKECPFNLLNADTGMIAFLKIDRYCVSELFPMCFKK